MTAVDDRRVGVDDAKVRDGVHAGGHVLPRGDVLLRIVCVIVRRDTRTMRSAIGDRRSRKPCVC